ncbi:MAG: monoamine oxidase [Clostridiales bacterium]|nr:monoamine oxidase [Clostridiales bacterium]
MIRKALLEAKHPEDYDNLMELLRPPKDILQVAPAGIAKGMHIGIIGAGLAGLCAAYELQKLGFDITFLELQQNRIGGRVHTYYFNPGKSLYGELGAMRIPVIHETVWHFIDLFGLSTRPFVQNNENAWIYVRGQRVRNDADGLAVMQKIYPLFPLTQKERKTPWQVLLDTALTSYFYTIPVSMRREILEIKKHYSELITALDYQNIRKVMESTGLSQGAINMLSGIMPFVGETLYRSYFESLQETYTVDSAYRYEIEGGMEKLPQSFYKFLKERAKEGKRIRFKMGCRVDKIIRKENKQLLLSYQKERGRERVWEAFDFVLCTIPFSSLRNVQIDSVLSAGKIQAIREVSYISAQKSLLLCKERFWERGGSEQRIVGGGSYTDLLISSTWYPSIRAYSLVGEEDWKHMGVLLASYNLGQDALRLGNLEPSYKEQVLFWQLEALHGLPKGYLRDIVLSRKSVLWNHEAGFYGGFCYYMPEQKRLFSFVSGSPEYDGLLYFAGEHTSSTHGWQQGAMHSGLRAANEIAAKLRDGSRLLQYAPPN